ncbi:excisionase family DNA-binding protein [Gordonia bronchialis]|nr:excisionase family DNA-binding protein [Gordonia bronchialis]
MTVRRWIWSGRIPATRLGPKLIRLDPEEVNEAITHAVA